MDALRLEPSTPKPLQVLQPTVSGALRVDAEQASVVFVTGEDRAGPWSIARRIVRDGGHALEPGEATATGGNQPCRNASRSHAPDAARVGNDDQVTSERAVAVLEEPAAQQARLARQRQPRDAGAGAIRRNPCNFASSTGASECFTNRESAFARTRTDRGHVHLVGESTDRRELGPRAVW